MYIQYNPVSRLCLSDHEYSKLTFSTEVCGTGQANWDDMLLNMFKEVLKATFFVHKLIPKNA